MALKDESQLQDFVRCDLSQQPVSFFCRRCGVNLCDPCLPIHLRMKSKNGHDIVDYTSKDDDDTCHRNYPSHKFVVLLGCISVIVLFLLLQNNCSAYCETCDAPICILCVSIKHSSHEMSELSDKIEEPLKVIAKENVLLQSSKHELERILDHTTKLLSSISSTYKLGKDEVTARGEKWHKQIEETVKKLHQELDDMQKEHEAVLQKQKKDFEEIIEKMNEINEKIIKLQKTKNVREMHNSIPCIRKRKIMSEVSQYSISKLYKRKIDELLENELTEKEFSCRRMLDVPIVTSVIDTKFPADMMKNRLYDMAVTDDNKVWMGGASRELNLFDLQGHLHHTVSITCRGFYLCMYNKKVVYSDPLKKVMRMMSDTDTVVTMFTTGDWEPYGVTSTASDDLLVCLREDDQSKVVRYSSTGTVLQEIQYDSQGQPLYKAATYVTENVNGDIIVTDWEKKAVIAVDRLGIFRYFYSEKESGFDVCSVATDSGHVFITDFKGDKIHMLDRDGRFLRYIIPEGGIKYPRGVCILGDGEMMVGECLTGIAKRIKYVEN